MFTGQQTASGSDLGNGDLPAIRDERLENPSPPIRRPRHEAIHSRKKGNHWRFPFCVITSPRLLRQNAKEIKARTKRHVERQRAPGSLHGRSQRRPPGGRQVRA